MLESLLFKPSGEPVYFLNDPQIAYLLGIFRQMREEFDTEYLYKQELMRNRLNLIFHEAIKMQPTVAY